MITMNKKMDKSENKTVPVIPSFGIHSELRKKIARVIESITDCVDQMSIFPHDIEDLRIPVEQAEEVREKVLGVFSDHGFDIETRDDAFVIFHEK